MSPNVNYSVALSVRGGLLHDDVGSQKAQKLPEGVWRQIPQKEHTRPVHLLSFD